MSDGSDSNSWRIADRYVVTGRIGSGGMADVLRARDELLQRDVAIKVFRSAVSAADTAAGVERQRAELLALARLNHPYLITLYDGAIPDDGPAYLVMELIDGPTLADRIDQGPLPSEADVRVIGSQVADALTYVHEQGMVHRDIKPANILLGTSSGGEHTIRARLSDFGIVRLLGAQGMTQANLTLGTASYLAPEQARGSSVGPPADVYALGLTLIEALTGVKSFDGDTPIEAVVARLDRDPHIPSSLPQPWPSLLAAMTARDPAARPGAQDVARALRSRAEQTTQFIAPIPADGGTAVLPAVAAAPVAAAPAAFVEEPYRPAAPPPKRRNTGLIVGLLLVLLLIGLGAAILVATSGGDDSPDTGTTPTPTRTSGSSSSRAPSSDTQQPTEDETTKAKKKKTKTKAPPAETKEPPGQTKQPPTQPSSEPASSSSSSSSPAKGGGPGDGGGPGGGGPGGPGNP